MKKVIGVIVCLCMASAALAQPLTLSRDLVSRWTSVTVAAKVSTHIQVEDDDEDDQRIPTIGASSELSHAAIAVAYAEYTNSEGTHTADAVNVTQSSITSSLTNPVLHSELDCFLDCQPQGIGFPDAVTCDAEFTSRDKNTSRYSVVNPPGDVVVHAKFRLSTVELGNAGSSQRVNLWSACGDAWVHAVFDPGADRWTIVRKWYQGTTADFTTSFHNGYEQDLEFISLQTRDGDSDIDAETEIRSPTDNAITATNNLSTSNPGPVTQQLNAVIELDFKVLQVE